jgi:predicted translin family RNA/ssDNA-binding protein
MSWILSAKFQVREKIIGVLANIAVDSFVRVEQMASMMLEVTRMNEDLSEKSLITAVNVVNELIANFAEFARNATSEETLAIGQ